MFQLYQKLWKSLHPYDTLTKKLEACNKISDSKILQVKKVNPDFCGNLITPKPNQKDVMDQRNQLCVSKSVLADLPKSIQHIKSNKQIFKKKKTLFLLSDCNGTQPHNHLVRKRTLNHLAKLASPFYSEKAKEFPQNPGNQYQRWYPVFNKNVYSSN